MTKFIRFIGTIIVLLLLIAIALDGIYTYVFTHSLGRNKIEQVMNGQPQQFDVVILGTSRANNHFVPELFEEKGYTAFKYGMSGCAKRKEASITASNTRRTSALRSSDTSTSFNTGLVSSTYQSQYSFQMNS